MFILFILLEILQWNNSFMTGYRPPFSSFFPKKLFESFYCPENRNTLQFCEASQNCLTTLFLLFHPLHIQEELFCLFERLLNTTVAHYSHEWVNMQSKQGLKKDLVTHQINSFEGKWFWSLRNFVRFDWVVPHFRLISTELASFEKNASWPNVF